MDIRDVKKNLNRKVRYQGGGYVLTGCIIRRSDKTGKFFYQAELTDSVTQNSLVFCRLEEVSIE